MAGIPGLDQISQVLGGLGLGGGAPAASTPAPAPAAPAQGLGMATPRGLLDTPGASGPEDLSDITGLQRLILRLGNASDAAQGRDYTTDQIRQQRQGQNKARIDAITQAMDIASKFGQELDKTPKGQLDGKRKMLRDRYLELAGTGGGEMFDTLVGEPGSWYGNIEAAKSDPYMQQLLMNGTPEQVRKYGESDQFRKSTFDYNDVQFIDSALAKFKAQHANQDAFPEYRKAFEEASKDGVITLDEWYNLQEYVPEGQRVSASEMAAAQRHPERFNGLPAYRTADQVEKLQDVTDASGIAEGRASRLAKAQHGYDMELQDKKNEGLVAKANVPPKPRTANSATLMNLAGKVITNRMKFAQQRADIEQIVNAPPDGAADYARVVKFISQLDNTAAREGEVETLRTQAASLSDRLKRMVSAASGGARIIGPELREQINAILRSSSAKATALEKDYLRQQVHLWSRTNGHDSPDQYFYNWRELFDPKEQAQLLGDAEPAQSAAPAGGGESRGAPTQEDVARIQASGVHDPGQIRAALKREGFVFPERKK